MTPCVSVVMAAKNYAKFLPMAVRSVQAQTMTDWELVIVDDGSTDDTNTVVQPFLQDRRIRYHRSDRLGQSRAKNLGVRLSRGKVIAFLDADDAWQPTKLEQQLPLLTGRVGVVHCGRVLIGESVLEYTPSLEHTLRSEDSASRRKSFAAAIYIANPICFSSTLVNREVLDFVGGFDPDLDLSIDYDLWLRVARHYDFAYVNQPLVLYRTGHGNLSKKLADRIATAFTIMHRNADLVDAVTRAEAYAMTCRSLAWAVRPAERGLALRWYARALAWPHRRWESGKGLLGVCKDWLFRTARPTTAENLSVNC